ncbi:hypothetical protein, partial [Acetobacter indonesiensis]|uniref:hypothetical protein n=1 Tax=Acetobacter indonesiensis TaxID=104101 RepID=UPI0022322C03
MPMPYAGFHWPAAVRGFLTPVACFLPFRQLTYRRRIGPLTRICLILENGVLGIFLEGDLAAMLIFASNKKNAEHHPDAGVFSKF